MILGALWDDAYLELQQKEQSYLMFINQLSKIHQNWPGINPMGFVDPWCDIYL